MTSMGAMGFIKRAVPFFAALVIGIFVASFFVDLNRPKFNGFRGRAWEKGRECRRAKAELENLRNEKLRLENELEALRSERLLIDRHMDTVELPPPPPMPLHHPREIRIEKLRTK